MTETSKKAVKKAAKAVAKKVTKKATMKTNKSKLGGSFNTVFGDAFLGTENEIGDNLFALKEKMMREITRKLNSLNLSEDDIGRVDLAQLLNSMPTPTPASPQEEAEDIVSEADDTDDPKKKIAIAKKALKIDSNNVSALVILAEHQSKNVFDAIDGYRRAIAAGERGFGEQFMQENVGHFWGIHETRPYMCAIEQLAGILRGLHITKGGLPQHTEESLELYQKLLFLNPGDNQGVRYKLLYFLLELDKDTEAEELHQKYSDDCSAWWLYGRALLDFRKNGDTATSRKSLLRAMKSNKHFPLYLLRRKEFPSAPPGHYGFGDANEAAYYMNDSFNIWLETPGAADWIEKYFDKK